MTRQEWTETLDKMKGGDEKAVQMALETAKNLKGVSQLLEKNLQSYADGKQKSLGLTLCTMMHAELDLGIIRSCFDIDSMFGDDDEDDWDDDRPYGYDGPMPWDEEEDKPDKFRERMESLCEKKLMDEECGERALLFPIPCTKNMPQVTVKDWLAKFDEEINELKEAILRVATLNTPIAKLKGIGKADKARIAEEGADVSTVVASLEERMGIDYNARADAQLHVNQHNKERGRW